MFTTDKTRLVTFSLLQFNLKIQFLSFYVGDRFESTITYDMIIGQDHLGELCFIISFKNKTYTWDTATFPQQGYPSHS
jgi:hypothetical protein